MCGPRLLLTCIYAVAEAMRDSSIIRAINPWLNDTSDIACLHARGSGARFSVLY